jgi:DNA processing protein
MREDIVYEIALSMVPGLGPVGQKDLISSFGTAKKVLAANANMLQRVHGIGKLTAEKITSSNFLKEAQNEIDFCEKHKINILSFFQDDRYPKTLLNCYDAPIILYHRGNVFTEKRLLIAMVGTRAATDYGKHLCAELMQVLKEFNPIIVSGLAYGIDVQSHKEALKAGLDTIAVVGNGLDTIYPKVHYDIAKDIVNQGAIITEFTKGVKPDRENFPARNRIIAGMCDVLVVVEAREEGGALITAELANSYQKDVFAFPGRIYDKQSRGCNYLLRQNLATILTEPYEIVQMLNLELKKTKQIQPSLFNELNDDEKILIQCLIENSSELGLDDLMLKLNWPMSKLSMVLLNLELGGHIKSLPGKSYKLY